MPGRKKPDNKLKPGRVPKKTAEKKARRSNGATGVDKKLALDKLRHELEVHQIELEMQNEELRGSQLELEESRAKYQDLYDFSPAGYFTISRTALIVEANLTGATLLGVPRSKLIQQRFRHFVADHDLDSWHRHLTAVFQQEKKLTCILELKHAGGNIFHARLDSIRMESGGTHMVRIAMIDVSEQIQAVAALRERDLRLRRFYESGMIGVMYWNIKGQITEANDKFLDMVGYSRDDLTAGRINGYNMTPPEYSHIDDSSVAELTATGVNKTTLEKEYIRKDGTRIPVILAGAMLDEARTHGVAFVLDDTERKEAEKVLQKKNDELVHVTTQLEQMLKSQDKARLILLSILEDEKITRQVLRESEEKYRLLIETTPCVICRINPDGTTIFVNNFVKEVTGYSAEELIGQNWWNLLYPGEPQGQVTLLLEALQSGDVHGYEMTLLSRDGLNKSIQWDSFNKYGMKGELIEINGVGIDITGRKIAEQQARYQLQFLYVVINAINAPIFFKDAEGHYNGCNTAFEEYMGLPLSSLVGKSVFDLWPRDLAEMYHQKDLELLAAGGNQTYEGLVRSANGIDRDVLYHKSVFYDKNGKIDGIVGVMVDITDRKQMEKDLRSSEEKYRTLVENLNDVIYSLDSNGVVTYMSSGCMRLFQYKPEEITGKNFRDFIYPDDIQAVLDQFFKTVAGENTELEYRVIDKDNTMHYIRTSVTPVFVNGRVTALNGILIETTDRRRAEEALRESEERLRVTLEATCIGIWDWDLNNDIWYASPMYFTMLGYEPDTAPLNRAEWLTRVHPEDRSVIEEKIKNVLEKKSSSYNYEARIKHADGTYRWHSVSGFIVKRDASGNAMRMLGIRMDITDRRRAEEAVRESERFALSTVNALESSIAILDRSGEIISVNSSWRTFAFNNMNNPIDVFEGVNYLSVCDAAQGNYSEGAAEFAAGIRAVMNGEIESYTQEYPCHSPAVKRWFIGKVNRFPGAGELRLVVSHTDITDRILTEKKIVASLREKEVLLREIHHRVKNNMQVISSLMGLQSTYITKGADIINAFSEMQNRIKSMAIVHEKLYQSADLSRIDFKEYLTSLVSSVIQSFMVVPDRIRLEINVAPVKLGIDMAVPSGLLLNELITNAFKHAFPGGRRGVITISIGVTDDGSYRMSVRDDGVGLPAGFDMNTSGSLGLRLVQILTQQLGGELDTRSEGGAEFIVIFPHEKEGEPDEGK